MSARWKGNADKTRLLSVYVCPSGVAQIAISSSVSDCTSCGSKSERICSTTFGRTASGATNTSVVTARNPASAKPGAG